MRRRRALLPAVAVVALIGSALAGCAGATDAPARAAGTASAPASGTASGAASGAASPGQIAAGGLDVVAENARRGASGWRIRPPAAGSPAPEGYLDHDSVLPGGSVVLRAASPTPTVDLAVFRVGWYGGDGARRVLVRKAVAVPRQPAARELPGTRAVVARWTPVATIDTSGWLPGLYYVRLDAGHQQVSYVPLVVRSADVRGRVVIAPSVLTWQAYNRWGGRSLYTGEEGGFGSRSYAVSFDRPYDAGGFGKSAQFDVPLVQAAERTGIPVAYLTTRDVALVPNVLEGAAGYVSDGHDEYWTPAERRAVEAARAQGTNLAFLGANVAYWRVRLTEGWLGAGRMMLGYKSAAADPQGSKASATVRFRDAPSAQPEEALTGQQYDCYPASGSFVVRTPSFFLFAGTGASRGTQIAGLVGVEIDRPYPSSSTPRPLEVPSLSAASCRGRRTWSAFTYVAPRGGAGTVAVGTMNWVRALVDPQPQYGITASGALFVQRVTANLLQAMAAGPMGVTHPSHDDLPDLDLPATSTVGGP